VATDFRQRIIVTESSSGRLLVFSPGGEPLKERAGLARPTGVATAPDGRILVGNAGRGNVEVYGADLALLYKLGAGDGEFALPLGITVDERGVAYVADGKEDRVKVYDGVGAFLFSFGSRGNGDGRFRFPTAVTSNDTSQEIVVADLPATPQGDQGARIQIFSRAGTFKRSFASFGVGEGLLVKPLGLATDGTGRIFVTDAYQNVVQAFDGNGVFLFAVHDPSYPLRTPLGIAIDRISGRLYVASMNTSKVVEYDTSGSGGGTGGGSGQTTMTFETGGSSCSVGGTSSGGASPYGDAIPIFLLFLWLARLRRGVGKGGRPPYRKP